MIRETPQRSQRSPRTVTRLELLAAHARVESMLAAHPRALARVRAKHRETLAALDDTAAALGIAGEWNGRETARETVAAEVRPSYRLDVRGRESRETSALCRRERSAIGSAARSAR